MRIRVATYNIHKGVSAIRSEPRVLALKQAISLFDADVVFCKRCRDSTIARRPNMVPNIWAASIGLLRRSMSILLVKPGMPTRLTA